VEKGVVVAAVVCKRRAEDSDAANTCLVVLQVHHLPEDAGFRKYFLDTVFPQPLKHKVVVPCNQCFVREVLLPEPVSKATEKVLALGTDGYNFLRCVPLDMSQTGLREHISSVKENITSRQPQPLMFVVCVTDAHHPHKPLSLRGHLLNSAFFERLS
jgi:hypothetical protein